MVKAALPARFVNAGPIAGRGAAAGLASQAICHRAGASRMTHRAKRQADRAARRGGRPQAAGWASSPSSSSRPVRRASGLRPCQPRTARENEAVSAKPSTNAISFTLRPVRSR